MLIEHRAYTMQPGQLARFYELQIERGFDLVAPIIERLLGYFSVVGGPQDQVVHLYRFDGYDDWVKRLHGLYGITALEPYFTKVRAVMLAQENKFLAPAPLAALTPLVGNGNDWLPGRRRWLDIGANPDMLIEESTLIMKPGSLPPYWVGYNTHGIAAGEVATSHLFGVFVSTVGRLHQVLHYRVYPNESALRAHRRALAANEQWQAFMKIVGPMTASADSKLMTPAPIAPMSPLFY
jgi:NIPSNAP